MGAARVGAVHGALKTGAAKLRKIDAVGELGNVRIGMQPLIGYASG